jgi:hypothetical protein
VGLAIAQSLCVIQLDVHLGNTWQDAGELQKVTVIQAALILYQTMQCIAAMAERAKLAARGRVLLTMSAIKQGQAALSRRVLQRIRGLYKMQNFWLGPRECFLIVSTNATLGMLELAPPLTD